MNMKTSWLIVTVLAVHVLALGILVMQGCRTTSKAPPAVKLPSELRNVQPAEPVSAPGRSVSKLAVPPPPLKAADTAPVAKTTPYVVRRGDTLSIIASRYNLRVSEIMALNKLSDPNRLREGQTLLLPGEVDVKVPPSPAPKKDATAVATRPAMTTQTQVRSGEYIVKAGDTLSGIAKAHGTTVRAIREANNLSGDTIKPGQKITIPARSPELTVPQSRSSDVKQVVRSAEPQVGAAASKRESAPAEQTSAGAGVFETQDGYREVVVGPDEDLYTIAMRWAVSVAELKKVNGLADDVVKPGQRLKIPIAE